MTDILRFHNWEEARRELFRDRRPWRRAVREAAGGLVQVSLKAGSLLARETRLLTAVPDGGELAFDRWCASLDSTLPLPFDGEVVVTYTPRRRPEAAERVEFPVSVGLLRARRSWLTEQQLRRELHVEKKGRLEAMSVGVGMLGGVQGAIKGSAALVWAAQGDGGRRLAPPARRLGSWDVLGTIAVGVAERAGLLEAKPTRPPGHPGDGEPQPPVGPRSSLPPVELRERSHIVLAWADAQGDEELAGRLGRLRGALGAAEERRAYAPLRLAFDALLADVERELDADVSGHGAASARRLHQLMTGREGVRPSSAGDVQQAPRRAPVHRRRDAPVERLEAARAASSPSPGGRLEGLRVEACPSCSELLGELIESTGGCPPGAAPVAEAIRAIRVHAESMVCTSECCRPGAALDRSLEALARTFVEGGGRLYVPARGERFDPRCHLLSEGVAPWQPGGGVVIEILAPGWHAAGEHELHPAWVRVGLPVYLPGPEWPGLPAALAVVAERAHPALRERLAAAADDLLAAACQGPEAAARAAFRAWLFAAWRLEDAQRADLGAQFMASVASLVLASVGGVAVLPVPGERFDPRLHQDVEGTSGPLVGELLLPGCVVGGVTKTKARVRTVARL